MSSKCTKLEGEWSGLGTETELDPNGVVTKTQLKLSKQIQKIGTDTYKVTETYFFLDGSVNYAPIPYIISTGGNNEKFITSDSFGIGIDFYNVDGKHMKYRYNINGAVPTTNPSQPYTSLDGVYKLKKH